MEADYFRVLVEMIISSSIKILVVNLIVIMWITVLGCQKAEEAQDRLYTPSAAVGVVKEHLSARTYDIRTAVAVENDDSCEDREGVYYGSTCYVIESQSCNLIDSLGAKWDAVFVPADRRGNVTRYWEVEVERGTPFLGKDKLRWLVYEKSGRVVPQTEPAC